MSDRPAAEEHWDATWDGSRGQLLESTRAATPAQRLEWLEEMLELACRAGAIARRAERHEP